MIRAAIIGLGDISFVHLDGILGNPEIELVAACDLNEELKKIIDSGEYGKIIGIRGFVPWRRGPEYYSVRPWRGTWKYAGGGSMINQSLHTLDLLYFLIEQDDSYGRDPFDCLRDSRAHLVELGYESWF